MTGTKHYGDETPSAANDLGNAAGDGAHSGAAAPQPSQVAGGPGQLGAPPVAPTVIDAPAGAPDSAASSGERPPAQAEVGAPGKTQAEVGAPGKTQPGAPPLMDAGFAPPQAAPAPAPQ